MIFHKKSGNNLNVVSKYRYTNLSLDLTPTFDDTFDLADDDSQIIADFSKFDDQVHTCFDAFFVCG